MLRRFRDINIQRGGTMNRSLARSALLSALLSSSALCAAGGTRADVVTFDNLANNTGGFGSVTATTWEAQKFNSDSTNLRLTSATLTLDSESGGSGAFFLRLYADAAGQPGAALATLSAGPNPFPGPFPQNGNVL